MPEAQGQTVALSLSALCKALAQPADTLLLMHRNPDGDTVGSAFALRELLTALGSRAFCVCESEIPERLRFLSDPIQKSVLLQAVPGSMQVTRVISVDVASPAQLGGLCERFASCTDLTIDHHETGTPFAKRGYIDGHAAATGEIVFDIVRQLLQDTPAIPLERIDPLLYAAISSDTGCFRYSNVTPQTHRRAAALLETGIDSAQINHLLLGSHSWEQLQAEAMGIRSMHTHFDGRVAVIAVSYAQRTALGLEDRHLETLVDVARSLAGVEVAIAIRQPTDAPVFRASLRSTGDYNVAELCAGFGGGGHAKAAGCTIQAQTVEQAEKMLVQAICFSQKN